MNTSAPTPETTPEATPETTANGRCDSRDLRLIIASGVPIIAVESHDELRVLELLRDLATGVGRHAYSWTVTRGLQRNGFGEELADAGSLRDAEALLRHIEREPGGALYTLCDFHPYLRDEPTAVRLLKDIALAHKKYPKTIVLLSHAVDMPAELSRLSARFQLNLPSEQELLAIVREEASAWGAANKQRVRADQRTLERLVGNLRGVSHADARTLVRHAIVHDGAITDSDLPEISRLKFQLLDAEGVLRFEHDTESMAAVAGFDNLKRWLTTRGEAFGAGGTHADRPRGVLLLGIQGGGKSLAARAIAGHWQLPLLRLDFGALYNKFIGETERNVRDSLRQAEQMAPCVLWMDEIEKGVATGGGDNATAQRVLGTLLTWLAENETPVFVVATANNVSALPPELMRKGRLDEIFFVDLPAAAARREILAIHLRKRGLDADHFDLDVLASVSEGFTGAEIEQAIVSARYGCAADGRRLDTAAVTQAIEGTYPISVVMREQIDALRSWAAGRTVTA